MDSNEKRQSLARLGTDGHVTAGDVLFLRRNVFADGVVSRDELGALFDLAARAPDGEREWPDFFAEAVADFYLREEEPQGYLTEEEFADLKARIAGSGRRANRLEIELMLRLMEKAVATPPALSAFLAEQIRWLVAERPEGPRLSAADAELVRRFLFAAGGDGNVAVTRQEAEFLFDLNDLTAGETNDLAWTELFVRAVANHLMAHLGYAPPSRAEALRRQAFIEDQSVNVGGFFKRMLAGGFSGFGAREKSAQARRNEARAAEAAAAEAVTAHEADWLAERISRDGAVRASERALIRHLQRLDAELPPKLKALLDKAA